jgi:hypothetical protein
MFAKNKTKTLFMAIVLCFTVTAMSSTLPAGTHALSSAKERCLIGAGNCSDFLNGFAIGMGVASLLGCVWCPGVAVASKTIEMFAC